MSANEREEKTVTVAAIQCALGGERSANVARVTELVREAAGRGAQVVLPPELFEGPYFCREEKDSFFDWSRPFEGNPTIFHFSELARELGVVIPVSFFERAGQQHYNSVAMIDADGAVLGQSEMYSSPAAMETGIRSVMANGTAVQVKGLVT